MKIEIVIIAVTAFLIYNTYHDGKYTEMLYKNKKGLQISFYAIIGLSFVLLMSKSPARGRQLLLHANDAIKYMPIDKQSAQFLSPILDFTIKDSGENTFMSNLNPMRQPSQQSGQYIEKRILSSGKLTGSGNTNTKSTKRSVSETKKKYVASMQGWSCGDCRQKLNAWFEVDHKVRLEYGGGNEVDNLVALCRNCHGKKTAFENM